MPSIAYAGMVVLHDYAGVNPQSLDLHATRIGCVVADYQRKLPEHFPVRTISACVVPDNVYNSWFMTERDRYTPPEMRTRVVPPASYGCVDDLIKFPASLLERSTLEEWEVEGISHEILHAGSRETSVRGLRCGIAFCGIDGKIESLDRYLNEGITEHVRMSSGGAVVKNRYYPVATAVRIIAGRIGEDTVLAAYFRGEIDPFIAAVERVFGPDSYANIKGLSRGVVKGVSGAEVSLRTVLSK